VIPTIRAWLVLSIVAIAWGCASTHSEPTTPQIQRVTVVVKSVHDERGHICNDAYANRVATELNQLKAAGQFDLAHECRCLPQTAAYIRNDYSRRLTNWDLIEVALAAPFSVASNRLPKWWQGKMISSVMVATYRGVTLVYLDMSSKGQELFTSFEYTDRGNFDLGKLKC